VRRYKIACLILILGLLLASIFACTVSDAVTDRVYLKEIYTWNGTAYEHLLPSGGGIVVEVDPVWTASDAFGITALNRANWTTAYNNRVDV